LPSFLSALLPSTPETLRHVLANAGLGLSPPSGLPVPILQVQPPTAAVPADAFEDDLDPPFNALVAETSSLISSPNFAHVLEAALDEASESVLLAGLLSAVFGRREPDASTAPEDELVPKLRLVDMLPGLARWSRLALTGLPNELVDVRHLMHAQNIRPTDFFLGQRLGEMREVRGISAVVFSAFSGSPVL
jgi:peroxin-3